MEALWKKIFICTFIICNIIWIICWVIILRLAYLQIDTPNIVLLLKIAKILQWTLPIPTVVSGLIYDYKRRQERKINRKK